MNDLEREEPIYRMFTDILSRFIIRSATIQSPPQGSQTKKYAHIEEDVADSTAPSSSHCKRVQFKEDSNVKSFAVHDMCPFAC